MFALSSTCLLGLALLALPMNAAAQTALPVCEEGTRHIELDVEASRKAPEVCIRPEVSTNLFFEARLARVEVERRERFRRVEQAEASLTLVPSKALHDGERVRVTVYFEGGAAPTSASFVLVVHPSQAERQVEVSRHERTLASYRQGEQQARAEVQQCREEKARLQARCNHQGGLTGLIANGWMGEKGVVTEKMTQHITQQPGNSLVAQKVISYRAVGPNGQGRVAVQVKLFNQGTEPWTPTGAALVGTKREVLTGLTVWPLEPIPPGQYGSITVEMNAAENEARDTFTLKLWGKEGTAQSMLLGDVTFP